MNIEARKQFKDDIKSKQNVVKSYVKYINGMFDSEEETAVGSLKDALENNQVSSLFSRIQIRRLIKKATQKNNKYQLKREAKEYREYQNKIVHPGDADLGV